MHCFIMRCSDCITMQCIAVFCVIWSIVLHCVAALCCIVLHCVAALCCMQHNATQWSIALHCTTVCFNELRMLQAVAVSCSMLQRVAFCCRVLLCAALCCNASNSVCCTVEYC